MLELLYTFPLLSTVIVSILMIGWGYLLGKSRAEQDIEQVSEDAVFTMIEILLREGYVKGKSTENRIELLKFEEWIEQHEKCEKEKDA